MYPPQLAPGSVLDQRFQITEAVAAGGMGTVFRARDLERDEPVALKLLSCRDQTGLQRFAREAQLLAELRHPSIVRYVSHGILTDGTPYLAMEWLSGEDLAHRLARQPLTLSETVGLGTAIASGLAAAHDRGVTHRDIKPANLFLQSGEPRRVKLLDFGIARLLGAEAATRTGTIVGTPDYMSPEQVRGERDIDGRADLFSLGCVLFECLIGQPPFASDQIMGVFGKILFEPTAAPDSLRPELPAALSDLVSRLLEKDRARRPGRAGEVLASLMAIPPAALAAVTATSPEASGSYRPRSLTAHEQRLLSLVVVSVSPPVTAGAPTVSIAPETSRLALLRELAQPFGAQVEQLPDGSLLALLFGQSLASDQARLAARLALRVAERWPLGPTSDDGSNPGRRPQTLARIAVCTGRGDLERGMLDAGSIERAVGLVARSGAVAPADRGSSPIPIVIDEMTRGLLDARFVTRSASGLHFLTAEPAPSEPEQRLLGRHLPFFGRDPELGQLMALLRDAIDEPRARAALVTADAGMGKSRLGQEFVQRLASSQPELTVWIGRSEPLGAGSPFALLAQSLRHGLGLLEATPADSQRELLRSYLERRLPAAERLRVGDFLGELLGLGEGGQAGAALEAARLDPMLMGDQIRRAVLDLLGAECRARPLLWVLEDLHWGDLPTVRLVDSALRQLSEQPLFVLALARPSVHDAFPRLWEGRDVQELRLSGLSRKASERIARGALGDDSQVAAVLRLLERTGGNAFFLEEMVRAAAAGQLAEAPATVLAMVQSRIERLEPAARRVLRAACLFGSVFWRGGVALLLGEQARPSEVESWLELLTERELLARRPDSRVAGEAEFTFVHALVRDAAYAMLTEADRALGHRLVAQYLEESGERDAVILAEHWERSGEHQRAIGWYRRAAWQALEGNDLEAVLRHSQRAVACGAVGEELGEVQAAQAEAYMWRGAYREAVGLGRLAMLELPPRSPRWFQVAGAVAIAAGRTSDSTQLGQLADRLQAVAGQGESSAGFLISALRTALQIYIAADYPRAASLVAACQPLLADPAAHPPAVEASIYMMQANLAAADWRLDVCPRLYEKSAALFEQIGDLRNACAQRLDAALFYTDIGEFSHSEQLARQIIVDSERLGIGRLLPVACGALAVTLFLQLRGDEAMVAGKRSIELAEAAGDQRISGIGRVLLGRYKLEQGDLAGAEQDLLIALAALSQLPRFRARAQAIYARILIAQGRAAEGLRSAGQGYAVLQALGRVGTDEGLIRLAYVEALDQFRGPFADPAADQATALEVLRQGRERLLAQAAQIADPVARRRFLELVDNASFLRCCEQRLGPIASPTADPAPPD